MVGRPSNIFHRYHEAGKTKIREKEIKIEEKSQKRAKRSWDTMRMRSIYGISCRTCRLVHLPVRLQERKFLLDGH